LGKLQRLMSRRSSGVENWTVERIFESRGLTLDAFRINQELNNHISQRKRGTLGELWGHPVILLSTQISTLNDIGHVRFSFLLRAHVS
jgi:hypothetical protein